MDSVQPRTKGAKKSVHHSGGNLMLEIASLNSLDRPMQERIVNETDCQTVYKKKT